MKSVPLRLVGDKIHIRKPLPMATSVRAFCCLSFFAQSDFENRCQNVGKSSGGDLDLSTSYRIGIVISRSPIATPTSLYTRQDCFTQWLNRDTMLQDNPKVYKALREIVANYEQVKPGGGGTGCGGRQAAEKGQKNAKPNLSKVNPPGKRFKEHFPAFNLSAVLPLR